jgi:predicted LPLAT superfamily acyltransferase
MSASNPQWAVQGERSNPLALWTITLIARHLGRWAGRLLLYPIVGYFLVALGQVRRHSRDYLGRVLGRPAALLDVARHLHCFASTLLDRVFVLTGRFEVLEVREHGPELLLKYAAKGQGCLLIGSHLGSFEVMRCLARTRPEVRVKVLMHRQQNPMMMQVVESLDPGLADAVIDTGRREADLILQVQQALEAGYCVGLLGDRVHGAERSARCDFLGGRASFPTSPYLLASMLKVPLVMCFALYLGGNRYELHFEELAADLHIPRAAREAELQAWAQRYASRLEHYARLAPYNWFNFYDFWSLPDATAEHH